MGWEMVSTEVLSTVAMTAINGEWLFSSCDALLTLVGPCPSLMAKLPVKDNTDGCSQTKTLDTFFFHFLLFIVFTKSPYSCRFQCK